MICKFSNRITSLTETLCHIYVHLSTVWHTLNNVLFHILVFLEFYKSNWVALVYLALSPSARWMNFKALG